MVERLMELHKYYLVTQSYERGAQECGTIQVAVLVSDYEDAGLARIHLNAMRGDRYAALIDLQKEEHRDRFMKILQPASGYTVYWSKVKSRNALS